ncbi:DnaJ like protein subfamily C member 7 [Angomonas deanei]|nr:DnaJ like protein subfamily C member 7 [Angomonas deanei]|eukprot:EPY33557.1 DnaJ like protein subfamily C member 7 [Angomonas deanei]
MDGSVASPSARDFDDDTSSVLIAERNDRSSIISDEAEARAKIMKFFNKKAAARGGPTSRDLKVEADKSYESANYTAALELYTKAIALQKEDGASQTKFLYGNRSAAYFMAGRFKECMEDCLVVFQMEPSNYKLLLRAALSAISMGDIERAVSILEIVPPKERESQEQLSVRYAEYKSALELYNKAESAFGTSEGDEMYRMLVAQFPTIVPFRERFAESLFRRKQYLRAVETLEVVSAKARPPKLLHLMANCLYLSGFEHFERARKCLEEVSQFDDDCRKLLNEINRVDDAKQKGNNNFSSKRFKESVEHYTAAINMAPNNLSILRILYCNRAAAYKEIGSYREGVEDCTRAIEIAPDFFKAYARRARCHINLGDNFAAVRDFKKALSLEKGDRELEKELRHAEAALSKEGEKEKDFYYQLGLTKTCSERDIKVKYRELSLRWHPDKCVGLDTLEKERAEHKFKIISEAYATLSDPAKRREYDWKQDRERLSRPAGFGFSGGFGAASGDQYRGNRYRARGGDTW